MAFEEIKAKLGLDITAFQQNASKAQGALKTLAGEATKKFTDMKQVGQAAATALGISYQAIADGIARFVIGFSKDQEQALFDLVNSTEKAADAQEAALRLAQNARVKLLKDIADKEEEYRRSKLTDDERTNELGKRLGQIMTERYQLEKQGFQNSERYLRLKNEQLDVQKELSGLEKKAISDSEKLAKLREDISGIEAETANIGKSDAELKVVMEKELLDLIKKRDAESDETKQLELTKKIAEQKQKIAKFTADALQKQKDLTKELETKQADLRAARIQDVKPTMEEVTSGKRNIGYNARQNARRLQAEQAKSQRLADQTQRAFDAIDQAKTPTERRDAQRTWNASRLALEASQERIKRGQEMLGTRIADANPYATMEAELKSIKTELTTLNKTTLAPTSTK